MIGTDLAHLYLAGQQICVRRPHLSVHARGNVVLCLHLAAQEQGRTGVLNHPLRFMGAPVVVINGSSIIIDYLSPCKQHYSKIRNRLQSERLLDFQLTYNF